MEIFSIEEERYRECGRERAALGFGCASDKPEIRIFPIPKKYIPGIRPVRAHRAIGFMGLLDYI